MSSASHENRRHTLPQISQPKQEAGYESSVDLLRNTNDEVDGRRQLEVSLSSIDELQDFETFGSNDLIYREYEPVILADSSHYERFDRLGQHTWKTGRPNHLQSLLHNAICALQTTLISGCFIGAFLTIVIYLDSNLAELCYSTNYAHGTVPKYVDNIRIVSDMVSSMVSQFWHFITLACVFGFSVVKESQIISWNLLASVLAGIYKLIYSLFMTEIVFWRSFPSFGIFIIVATFNSFRISHTLTEFALVPSPYLVIQLIIQFVIGIPVIYIFTAWIIPSYKNMSDVQKIAFASFVPLIIAIPKMILRKSVEYLRKVNHPGTTVYLLMVFYTSASLLLRTLQIQIYSLKGYIVLSVIYGVFSTIERAILPYVDFLQHKFFRGKKRNLTEFMTPRHNRLMSDLTLTTMITEPAMIFLAGTGMAILQYFYGHDEAGNIYSLSTLCKDASSRIASGILIEIVFNIISLKVESYYFNMPVMKVWQVRKLWFIVPLLVNTTIALMCFSRLIYDAMSTNDFFDGELICSSPFSRPVIKLNHTH